MTSFRIFTHGQKAEKNIPVSIHTSCHYSFRFPKFFHQNKLLPLSSANPKKTKPPGTSSILWTAVLDAPLFYIFTKIKSCRSFISEKSGTLVSVVRQSVEKIINFLVKTFKMQHMGSFVYRILSLPLSTLVLYTYILSYSPFILLAITTVALAFASQNQTSLEAMFM